MSQDQTIPEVCQKCSYNKHGRPACIQEHGKRNQTQCPAIRDPLTAQFADMMRDVPVYNSFEEKTAERFQFLNCYEKETREEEQANG